LDRGISGALGCPGFLNKLFISRPWREFEASDLLDFRLEPRRQQQKISERRQIRTMAAIPPTAIISIELSR
jgi:hypothetical protein